MKKNVKYMTSAALIAALYTALTLVLAPLSFGPLQIRLSETLCVLPAVFPPAVLGLSLGCFLSNLIGFFIGANPLGLIDCVLGTLATFLAAYLTYLVGKKCRDVGRAVFSLLPPIILNAVFIGAEIAYLYLGDLSFATFILSTAYVAAGEAIACCLGLFFLSKRSLKIIDKLTE